MKKNLAKTVGMIFIMLVTSLNSSCATRYVQVPSNNNMAVAGMSGNGMMVTQGNNNCNRPPPRRGFRQNGSQAFMTTTSGQGMVSPVTDPRYNGGGSVPSTPPGKQLIGYAHRWHNADGSIDPNKVAFTRDNKPAGGPVTEPNWGAAITMTPAQLSALIEKTTVQVPGTKPLPPPPAEVTK